MVSRKTKLLGFQLPFFLTITFVLLILISFMSSRISSIVFAEKLILLTAAISPVIFVLGATVSIAAFFKSEVKIAAFATTAMNVALLIILFYFSKSFLIELEFLS